jgi:pyruvate kinase
MIGTIDFAIAAVFRANFYTAIGIFPFTAEGGTVRAMSRYYPETPIYALTNQPKTAQLLLLHRCTHPILIDIPPRVLKRFGVNDLKELVRDVVDIVGLRDRSTSNYAIGIMAHPPFQPGGADTLLRIRLGP